MATVKVDNNNFRSDVLEAKEPVATGEGLPAGRRSAETGPPSYSGIRPRP